MNQQEIYNLIKKSDINNSLKENVLRLLEPKKEDLRYIKNPIEIVRDEKKIKVSSPYMPELPGKCKMLGGKWKKPYWVFNIRDEIDVEDLYRDFYGFWEEEDLEVEDIKVDLKDLPEHPKYAKSFYGYRLVASRYNCDSDIRLGNDIKVISGEFEDCCGSRKIPRVTDNNIIVLIRDVPVKIIKKHNLNENLIDEN